MNLENFGVQEMSTKQMVVVGGGWWDRLTVVHAVYTARAVIEASIEASKATLGFLAGVGDGIREGLE